MRIIWNRGKQDLEGPLHHIIHIPTSKHQFIQLTMEEEEAQ